MNEKNTDTQDTKGNREEERRDDGSEGKLSLSNNDESSALPFTVCCCCLDLFCSSRFPFDNAVVDLARSPFSLPLPSSASSPSKPVSVRCFALRDGTLFDDEPPSSPSDKTNHNRRLFETQTSFSALFSNSQCLCFCLFCYFVFLFFSTSSF